MKTNYIDLKTAEDRIGKRDDEFKELFIALSFVPFALMLFIILIIKFL